MKYELLTHDDGETTVKFAHDAKFARSLLIALADLVAPGAEAGDGTEVRVAYSAIGVAALMEVEIVTGAPGDDFLTVRTKRR